MTNTTKRMSQFSSRTLNARVLVYALLALISFNATVEAVHNHDYFLGRETQSARASIGDASDSDARANQSKQSGECLICQLQRQMVGALIAAPPFLSKPLAQAPLAQTPLIFDGSIAQTPSRGRAPPSASLL